MKFDWNDERLFRIALGIVDKQPEAARERQRKQLQPPVANNAIANPLAIPSHE